MLLSFPQRVKEVNRIVTLSGDCKGIRFNKNLENMRE
jgi:hypothetical protein